jgi:hypothetical protein
MRRRVAGIVAVLLAALAGATAAHAAGPGVSVDVDRTEVSTQIGRKFVFRSTIVNHGSRAAPGLIAHLNVLSLRDGTYVDPEDWSSRRTRYLRPLHAGASTTITWHMEAVDAGSFGVYVAVLRVTGEARPPTTAPAIHVGVASRTTLNSGGILPLVLGIPAALGLAIIALRLHRRSQSVV